MKKLLVALVILLTGLTLGAWSTPVKQWRLAYPTGDGPLVDVIDLSGVCLYVARSYGNSVAITTISKTQLPGGAGCQ